MSSVKLLLLDINGLLCCKTKNSDNNIKISSYYVILRPFYKEFLDFCYNHFHVGFFSSTPEKNARMILKHLLTKEQIVKTKLFWFRDRTHLDFDIKTERRDVLNDLDISFDTNVIQKQLSVAFNTNAVTFDTFDTNAIQKQQKVVFDTIKKLNDIYDNPVVNSKHLYHSKNTILIDDTFKKVRYNELNNIIICQEFTGDEKDIHLIELMHIIVDQFELIKN